MSKNVGSLHSPVKCERGSYVLLRGRSGETWSLDTAQHCCTLDWKGEC